MKFRIPPHIAWPGFVVLLLGLSITAAVLTLVLANSDGGVQVIDDYYTRAVHFDEAQSRRAAFGQTGWTMMVDVEAPGTNAGLHPVVVTFRDAEGAPVTGLRGTLRALRPQRARAVATIPLVEAEPGVYRQQVPVNAAGLWDFEVEARRDTLAVEHTVRLELGAGAGPPAE